jgi:hypothetical protein
MDHTMATHSSVLLTFSGKGGRKERKREPKEISN